MILTLTIALAFCGSLLVNMFMERLQGTVFIIPPLLKLSLTHNPYIAFSIALPSIVQTVLILSAFIAVCFVAFRAKDTLSRLSFGLIIGGAAANIVDRMMDGLVTDYVSFGTFPVFNAADVCISIGAGLLILEGVRRGKRH